MRLALLALLLQHSYLASRECIHVIDLEEVSSSGELACNHAVTAGLQVQQ
jgi:hypothetical protein